MSENPYGGLGGGRWRARTLARMGPRLRWRGSCGWGVWRGAAGLGREVRAASERERATRGVRLSGSSWQRRAAGRRNRGAGR